MSEILRIRSFNLTDEFSAIGEKAMRFCITTLASFYSSVTQLQNPETRIS